MEKIKDFFYYVGMSILTGNPKEVEKNMALKKKLKNLDSEIEKNNLETKRLYSLLNNLKYTNPGLS